MCPCKVIVILAGILVVFVGYTSANPGALQWSYHDEIARFESIFKHFIAGLNISKDARQGLHEIWNRTSELFKEKSIESELKKIVNLRLPDDPDAKRNSTELIKSKGLRSEEHHVTTADGFILTIVRVLPAKKKINSTRLPVFLLHGLLSSSDCFVNNERNESLAFVLVDQGYDVWMGNVRGNRYSTKHRVLQPSDKKFWEWSFDEMGLYDIPVMVDYVLSQTKHSKLTYIGHSEGTTNLVTSVIANGKELSLKVDKFIALCPAVYVGNSRGLLKDLAKAAKIIQKTWDLIDEGDVFAHDGIIANLGKKYCYDFAWLCTGIIHAIVGPGLNHFNTTRTPVYMSHAPAGTSTQNMVHWSQQCDGGNELVYYNYGSAWKNFEHYHRFTPPVYNLKKFDVETYAFLGTEDWLVVPQDGIKLLQDLPNVKWWKMYKEYNHIDYVWGFNTAEVLQDISKILWT